MSYKKYIKAITELNNLVSNSTEDEIMRYSESDIFWANNKKNISSTFKYRKGDVCQFEFGKNYVPEMSYEHRGLVIGVNKKLLYVLPICSKNPSNPDHVSAYHPSDNPIISNFYLLKKSEFTFLKHDSVLKINDLRTISIARKKYKQGNISCSSPTFIEIERKAFARIFPTYSFSYDEIENENYQLKEENDLLQREKDKLILELKGYQDSKDDVAISKD